MDKPEEELEEIFCEFHKLGNIMDKRWAIKINARELEDFLRNLEDVEKDKGLVQT